MRSLDAVIGQNVRARRVGLGLIQAELAARLVDLGQSYGSMDHPSASTVARLEAGDRRVRASELIALAAALQTTLDVLLDPRQFDDGTPVLVGDKPWPAAELSRFTKARTVEGLDPNLQLQPEQYKRLMEIIDSGMEGYR